MFVGPKFPLERTGKNTGFDSYREDEIAKAVKFNLKNIILTHPGERIWDDSFGVGIERMLFEPIDSSVLDKYKNIILGQIESYAPYIEIEILNLYEVGDSDKSIKIEIQFSINRTDITDTLEIEINGDLI
jgi:phage baseplate assembly protein W